MPRKRSASRKCLANGCSKLVEPPAVFCGNHWDQVPETFRETIQRAIVWEKHDEAVTLVTEGIRYLDTHKTPRRIRIPTKSTLVRLRSSDYRRTPSGNPAPQGLC